jgi:hypothetical protein
MSSEHIYLKIKDKFNLDFYQKFMKNNPIDVTEYQNIVNEFYDEFSNKWI